MKHDRIIYCYWGANGDLKMSIKICVACIVVMAAAAATNFSPPSSKDGGLQENILQAPIISFDDLLDAIKQVESGGNAKAIGDNGNAVGSFQIWKIYVDDVNRILREQRYSYSDRYDPKLSRSMAKAYIGHYATEKRLKRPPTFEDMAKIHNGGPNGYRKECTKPYWKKIEKELTK